MNASGKSYEKVHYEFRPAKQVERRMILDLLQKLMEAGFRISSYQYTGLGSLYFVDFILFRRYLGITRMISAESSPEVEKRVKFNKPYGSIDIYSGDIADFIPCLSLDCKHILWLDYDRIITKETIDAIVLAATQLSPGSLLFVTVDAEPPIKDGKTKQWRQYFQREARDYLGNIARDRQCARSRLTSINASIIEKSIMHGLAGRSDVRFFPLVNFVYADSHRMLSVGGMLGTDDDGDKLKTLSAHKLPFLRSSIIANPYKIRVPLLTRKERLHLDGAMPCRSSWRPREFEMKIEDVQIYREIYPYFPAYTEMLL
ncbi:MAG: O-methyltransferase [Verrucomicrobiota bacterium]